MALAVSLLSAYLHTFAPQLFLVKHERSVLALATSVDQQ